MAGQQGEGSESARPARVDDLEHVCGLAARLHDEVADLRGGDLWRTRESREQPHDATYRALLERDDALLVVGTYADSIVGFGAVEIEQLRDGRRLAVVTDLYVEPDARKVGVGEAMAEALLGFAAERDVVGVDAFALPGDRHTKNFFEGQGFSARGLLMHRSG